MYTNVVVAGTFDGLHVGHTRILERAFREGSHVSIGLTTDDFVKTFKKEKLGISSFQDRKNALIQWLIVHGYFSYELFYLDDPYGPIFDGDFDALVVSTDTEAQGNAINQKRISLGKTPLALIVVPMVPAVDGRAVSSSRMRRGEIDSQGNFLLPDELRSSLKKPMGELLTDALAIQNALRESTVCITVGDNITQTAIEAGIQPSVCIIDQRIQRQPVDTLSLLSSTFQILHCNSGPGGIRSEAIEAIKTMLGSSHPSVLVVDGEEDLLVIPVILYAREGVSVFYGQPNEGVVRVTVTPEKKHEMQKLFKKFVKQ